MCAATTIGKAESAQAAPGSQSLEPKLRVTTWNVLAPVIPPSKMFPGVPASATDQHVRRAIIQRQLSEMDSDVVLLQEVRPSELHAMLQEGEMPLGNKYEHHMALEKRGRLQAANAEAQHEPSHATSDQAETQLAEHGQNPAVPRALGSLTTIVRSATSLFSGKEEEKDGTNSDSEFGEKENRRGVAILWRKELLTNVHMLEESIGNPLNPAVIVKGFLSSFGSEVLFASKHLDALGLPPSVAGAERELIGLTDALVQEADSNRVAIVYGGDCNLTTSSPAFGRVQERGFRIASENLWVPTCFAIICSSRLDHIFTNGILSADHTVIPECSHKHCCVLVPFFHYIQKTTDIVSQALTRRKTTTCCQCILGYVLLLPLVLILIFVFIIPLPCSMRRCRWALEEYGSDHLPVTVTLLKNPASARRSGESDPGEERV